MSRPQRNRMRSIILAAFLAVGTMFAQAQPARAILVVCPNCSQEITTLLQYATQAKQFAQDAQSLYYLIKNYQLNVQSLLSIEVAPDPTMNNELTQIRQFLARAKYFVVLSQSGVKLVLQNDFKHPSAQPELLTPEGRYSLADARYQRAKDEYKEYSEFLLENKKSEDELGEEVRKRLENIKKICDSAKMGTGTEKSGNTMRMSQCLAEYQAFSITQSYKQAKLTRAIAAWEAKIKLSGDRIEAERMYYGCVMEYGKDKCPMKLNNSGGGGSTYSATINNGNIGYANGGAIPVESVTATPTN